MLETTPNHHSGLGFFIPELEEVRQSCRCRRGSCAGPSEPAEGTGADQHIPPGSVAGAAPDTGCPRSYPGAAGQRGKGETPLASGKAAGPRERGRYSMVNKAI